MWLEEGQVTFLGTQLKEAKQLLVVRVLDSNFDLFVWLIVDMLSIDPNYHCHRLSICQDARPIAQKKIKNIRRKVNGHSREVRKLIAAKFIQEV